MNYEGGMVALVIIEDRIWALESGRERDWGFPPKAATVAPPCFQAATSQRTAHTIR